MKSIFNVLRGFTKRPMFSRLRNSVATTFLSPSASRWGSEEQSQDQVDALGTDAQTGTDAGPHPLGVCNPVQLQVPPNRALVGPTDVVPVPAGEPQRFIAATCELVHDYNIKSLTADVPPTMTVNQRIIYRCAYGMVPLWAG